MAALGMIISDERVTLVSPAFRYTPFDAKRHAHLVSWRVRGGNAFYDFTKPVRIGDRLALPDVVQTVADGVRIAGYDTSLLTDGWSDNFGPLPAWTIPTPAS